MRVLVIDDKGPLLEHMLSGLNKLGFAAECRGTRADAEEALAHNRYDAVVLEPTLPDGDGDDLIRNVRVADGLTPILIVSDRLSVPDKVRGLDLGADDYLVKPIDVDELAARIRAVTRRAQAVRGESLRCGNLVFEPRLRALRVGGQPLVLSRRECELLELLLRRAGEPIGKFELDQAIYGDNARHGSNSLEVLVHRLRRRLANSGSTAQLQTVRGVGYVLVEA